MKKMLTVAAMAFAATGLQAAGGWEQFHGTDGNTGRAARGPDLRVYGAPRFAATVEGYNDLWGFAPSATGPVVMDGRVFCYGNGGAVSAFDESSGECLWRTPVAYGNANDSNASPSASNGRVYVGSGTALYCLDAEDGAVVWEHDLEREVVNAAVTVAEGIGLCFLHTWGAGSPLRTRLHAVRVADGTLAWSLDMGGQGQGNVAYNAAAGLLYTTVGAADGGWASGRGGIAAIDAVGGTNVWFSAGSLDRPCYGGVAFDAARGWVVAAGDTGGSSYSCLLVCDAATGATVAQAADRSLPSGNYTPTIGADGWVYGCGAEWDDGPYVFAYNPATGDVEWQFGEMYEGPFGSYSVSLAYAQDIGGGTSAVYCPSSGLAAFWDVEEYAMFDAADGTLLATLPMTGGNAALANGNLYFVNWAGDLVAFGPPVHIVEVDCGADGSVSPSRRQGVAEGESVTFTFEGAVADVRVNGVSVGAVASYTFANVTGNETLAVTFRPTLSAALPENHVVGVPFVMQAEVRDSLKPARFSASKLPPGLKIDATTGVISGVPTKVGVYAPVITAVSVADSKNAVSAIIPIAIEALPLNAQGTFNGVIADGSAAVIGTFTATVSATGKFSAKVASANGTLSFSAPSWTARDGDIFTVAAAAKAGQAITLALDVSSAWNAWQMTGALGGGLAMTAQRNQFANPNYAAFNASLNALGASVGYHTVALEGALVPGSTGTAANIPAGYGYLTATVSDKGAVKLAGKLADGTSVSRSATLLTLGDAGVMPCFAPLYGARGFFSAMLAAGADGRIGGVGDWSYPGKSPAAKVPATEDRFTMEVAARGARYSTLATLASHYAGAALSADGTGLATLIDNGKGALKPDTAAATFSANAKTGVFTGKIKAPSATHRGVLVQLPGGGSFGAGYYLVTEPLTLNGVKYTVKRSHPICVER